MECFGSNMCVGVKMGVGLSWVFGAQMGCFEEFGGERWCLGRNGVYGGEKGCLGVKRGDGGIMGCLGCKWSALGQACVLGVNRGVGVQWGVWGANGVL